MFSPTHGGNKPESLQRNKMEYSGEGRVDPKERVFEVKRNIATHRPECRRTLSITSDNTKHTAVTQHPVTNNGFRYEAPTSDM